MLFATSTATIVLSLSLLTSGQEFTWESVGAGRGCCRDINGDPVPVVTKPSNADSISQCRSRCETFETCGAIEYNKDTDRCLLFAEFTVAQVVLDDGPACNNAIRCQKQTFIPATAEQEIVLGPEAGPDPDTSNFSVQGGFFNYLSSFLASFTPPFGTFSGTAQLVRTAQGKTKASVAFSIGVSEEPGAATIEDLGAMTFIAKLHTKPCDENGGETYQTPFSCDPRCNSRQVEASIRLGSPVELHLSGSPNIDHFQEVILEVDWDVHIPDLKNSVLRTQMSMIIYDPSQPTVPMMCADLEEDRTMTGVVYYINTPFLATEALAVPVVTRTKVTRTELGYTEMEVKIGNLYSSKRYTAVVHIQPCVPFIPPLLENRGGVPYHTGASACYGNIGSAGCEDITSKDYIVVELPVGDLGLPFEYTYVGHTTERFTGILRAEAASIVVNMCDGLVLEGCNMTELVCLDLVQGKFNVATSSTTVATQVVTQPPTGSPHPQGFPTIATSALPVTATSMTETTTVPAVDKITNAPTFSPNSLNNPTDGNIDGNGDGNVDGSGSGNDGVNGGDTTPAARVVLEPVVNNPCDYAKLVYNTETGLSNTGGKGGKKSKGKKSKKGKNGDDDNQLDFTENAAGTFGLCCLPETLPDDLMGFSLVGSEELTAYTTSHFMVVLVAMGVVVSVGGVAMIAQRRYAQHQKENGDLAMEYATFAHNPYLFDDSVVSASSCHNQVFSRDGNDFDNDGHIIVEEEYATPPSVGHIIVEEEIVDEEYATPSEPIVKRNTGYHTYSPDRPKQVTPSFTMDLVGYDSNDMDTDDDEEYATIKTPLIRN